MDEMATMGLLFGIARSVPGSASAKAVAAQAAAEAAQAGAEAALATAQEYNYAVSVSGNTLVITPPSE